MDPPTGLRPMVWGLGKPEGMPTIFKLLQALVEAGHNVHFLSVVRPEEQVELGGEHGYLFTSGIHSHLLKLPRERILARMATGKASGLLSYLGETYQSIYCLSKLIRIIGQIRPDVVYAGKDYQFLGGLSGKLKRVPTISRFYGVHTLYNSIVNRKLLWEHPKEFFAFKMPSDQIIITNDGSQGDKVARSMGVPAQRLNFWINGVDHTIYQSGFDRVGFLDGLGIPRDSRVILTLCRLINWKKVDNVIRAVPRVVQQAGKVVFLIVGDGPERHNLENLAQQLGVSTQVKFVGAIPHDDVSGFMNAADIFVSLHDLANLPVPVLEAMSCGKCIVSLDDGALDGLIESGKRGVLIKSDSVDAALPDILLDLLNDEPKRQSLGTNAREFAVNNLETWDDRISKEIKLISEVVLRNRSRKQNRKGNERK